MKYLFSATTLFLGFVLAQTIIAPMHRTIQPLGVASGGYSPSLDFSKARNSQYIPFVGI